MRFNERIRIAGKLIDDEPLIALLGECERVNAGQSITYFEITTAAAFLAFARQPADVTLIETGLGGRFDASNVFAEPLITAITPVSLDHQHFLGDTVARIAFEKAGIFKPRVPAVLGAANQRGGDRYSWRMRMGSARRFIASVKSGACGPATAGLHYESRRWKLDLPPPGLLGRHQYDNAGTALACLDRAGLVLAASALAEGVRGVEWPARLEHLTTGALVEMLPPGRELWLDGGHNQAGGAALGAIAREWQDKPLRLVFGMLEGHDAVAFLKSLAPSVAAPSRSRYRASRRRVAPITPPQAARNRTASPRRPHPILLPPSRRSRAAGRVGY